MNVAKLVACNTNFCMFSLTLKLLLSFLFFKAGNHLISAHCLRQSPGREFANVYRKKSFSMAATTRHAPIIEITTTAWPGVRLDAEDWSNRNKRQNLSTRSERTIAALESKLRTRGLTFQTSSLVDWTSDLQSGPTLLVCAATELMSTVPSQTTDNFILWFQRWLATVVSILGIPEGCETPNAMFQAYESLSDTSEALRLFMESTMECGTYSIWYSFVCPAEPYSSSNSSLSLSVVSFLCHFVAKLITNFFCCLNRTLEVSVNFSNTLFSTLR